MAGRNAFRGVVLGIGLIATCIAMPARAADENGAKAPPAPPQSESSRPAASPVERLRAIVEGLNLNDDQKLKSGMLFDAARDAVSKLDSKADPAVLKQKAKAIFDKLRKDIGEVLTNEQKVELIKKMMPPGPTAIIDKIKQQLASPESKLTDEQKQKAFSVLDDAKKKLEDIRSEAQNGGKDTPAKMNAVIQDMKVKLGNILTSKESAAKKSE